MSKKAQLVLRIIVIAFIIGIGLTYYLALRQINHVSVIYSVETKDLIYCGDNEYCELFGYIVYAGKSNNHKALSIGDIVRVNARFRTVIQYGSILGHTMKYLNKIYSFEVVTDLYYDDNDFAYVTIGKDLVLPDYDFYKIYDHWSWRYLYDTDSRCYVSIIRIDKKQLVIKDGTELSTYDDCMRIKLDNYEHILLANENITVSEIEEALRIGDYSKFYYLGKRAIP